MVLKVMVDFGKMEKNYNWNCCSKIKMKIESDRLIIKNFSLDMAAAVHKNSLDDDTRCFLPDEVFESSEETRQTIDFLMSQYGSFDGPQVYPLITKKEGGNIGYVQLVPLELEEADGDSDGKVGATDGKLLNNSRGGTADCSQSKKKKTWEIGYHIAKKYTGRGYATEAVKVFLPFMAKLLGLKEVYGICLAENLASKRVLQKCGFEFLYEGAGFYKGQSREIFKGLWRNPLSREKNYEDR